MHAGNIAARELAPALVRLDKTIFLLSHWVHGNALDARHLGFFLGFYRGRMTAR